MKHFLTMFSTAVMGGVAALALTSAHNLQPNDDIEIASVSSSRLPEPSNVYLEHMQQSRNLRATVVPASYVTFVPVGEDDDVDAGVLLANPSDYEGMKLARLIGVQMAPVESCAKELKAHSGHPICEVVK